MFVLYLLIDDTRAFDILTPPQRFKLTTIYSHESVWMVPGTVVADD